MKAAGIGQTLHHSRVNNGLYISDYYIDQVEASCEEIPDGPFNSLTVTKFLLS